MKGFMMKLDFCLNAVLIASVLSFAALRIGAQTKVAGQPRVSILEKDRRLSGKISLEYSPIQGKGFLKSLWNKSGCEFTTIGGAAEFPTDFFTVRATDVTVRDMMESYACYYRVKWQKTKLGYALLTGNAEMEAAFAPKNPFAAARGEAGTDFVNGVKNLSEHDRNRLGSSIPLSALPSVMQDAFKKMIISLENQYGENGGFKPGVLSGQLGVATIRLSAKVNEGVTIHNFDFHAPSGGGGFSTTDYLASKARRESEDVRKSQTGEIGAIYDPEKFELTQKELNRLDVLKQVVSINVKNAGLVDILNLLHEKYKISILCSDPKYALQKGSINLASVTLFEAIKSLEKKYKKTQWIWMRNSFLVVRGPGGLQSINHTVQPEGGLKLGP